MTELSFVGGPCGQYGNYTFHKGFKFCKGEKLKVINLGEFFFVRISTNHDPCIGELQLLWSEANTDHLLSSVRLYFLPEQTPEGRSSCHGEDEVLAASDNVVLRLEDLVSWITDEVDWNHGLVASCADDVNDPPQTEPLPVESATAEPTKTDGKENDTKDSLDPLSPQTNARSPQDSSASDASQKKREDSDNGDKQKEEEERTVALSDQKQNTDGGSEDASGTSLEMKEVNNSTPVASPKKIEEEKPVVNEKNEIPDVVVNKEELRVLVLSYPSYCRYRSVGKRLDGLADQWLKNALVVALGGFTSFSRNTHILFSRDTFEHEELSHHELNCEYLAPILKMKRKKKKGKTGRSNSPGSESNTSEESKDISIKNNVNSQNNGFKQPPCKNEQEFLQRLYKFMKKRKTPIHRVPHLGFKQIDLFVFFSFAQKLGGYDKITGKRLWKHVYDELGGDPGSTSAATCTRRHYEKLLLPFERFLDGKEYKKPKERHKDQDQENAVSTKSKDENDNEKTDAVVNGKGEDTYAFTDSNHENSKDSMANERNHSGDDDDDDNLLNENYSDEDDSKPLWNIVQKAHENREKDLEKEDGQQITPLVIQKEQNESFSEKERKWNEIRRKNALARKWVRQLRPSRGGRSSSCEKTHISERETCTPKQDSNTNTQVTIKKELNPAIPPECKQSVKVESPDAISHTVKTEKTDKAITNQNIKRHLEEKLNPAALNNRNVNRELNDKKFHPSRIPEQFLINQKFQTLVKNESFIGEKKPGYGYPGDNSYPFPSEKYPYGRGYDMNMLHNFIKQEYKPHVQIETNGPKSFVTNTKSSDSSVLSPTDLEASCDGKPQKLSQRRPSVIQHTEFITSPSPSQSPKQMNVDSVPDTLSLPFGSSSKAMHHMHNVAGKVLSEWLAKGLPASKAPSAIMEKMGELHDKVSLAANNKVLGPGTSKVPMYAFKNKNNHQSYASSPYQPVREKGPTDFKPTGTEIPKKTGFVPVNNAKVDAIYQKSFHPISTMASSFNTNNKRSAKQEQMITLPDKGKQYSEPFFNQPKRHRLNTVPQIAAPVPPRPPSLLPFSRQQTYRTSPLSDIPKTAAPPSHSDYENAVLDLSVKKPPEKTNHVRHLPLNNSVSELSCDDGVCLDLSVKKKQKTSLHPDNTIENITPPLPISPRQNLSYLPSNSSIKPSKPLPTLISFQDLIREEANKQKSNMGKPTNTTIGSSLQPSVTHSSSSSSLAMPSNIVMFPGSAHSKIPSNFLPGLPPGAFTKEMSESLYMPTDPTQFPPYVIPPFYPANWPIDGNLPNVNSSKNLSTSPNSYKESVSHSVFPKQQYLYNYKHQFHPLLCKDNTCYPPSCK